MPPITAAPGAASSVASTADPRQQEIIKEKRVPAKNPQVPRGGKNRKESPPPNKGRPGAPKGALVAQRAGVGGDRAKGALVAQRVGDRKMLYSADTTKTVPAKDTPDWAHVFRLVFEESRSKDMWCE